MLAFSTPDKCRIHQYHILHHSQTKANTLGIPTSLSDVSHLTLEEHAQAALISVSILCMPATPMLSKLNVAKLCITNLVYILPLSRMKETLEIVCRSSLLSAIPPDKIILDNLCKIDLYSGENRQRSNYRGCIPKGTGHGRSAIQISWWLVDVSCYNIPGTGRERSGGRSNPQRQWYHLHPQTAEAITKIRKQQSLLYAMVHSVRRFLGAASTLNLPQT